MAEPFSRAGYSWASDGKLLLRTALLPDVPEISYAPNVERVWPEQWPETGWRQPLRRELPEPVMVCCTSCDGRGRRHKCPHCQCICDYCDGEGKREKPSAVKIGGSATTLHHARLIIALDWAEIAPVAESDFLIRFRFDGGAGVVTTFKADHGLDVVGEI